MPFETRLTIAMTAAFVTGLTLGMSHGGGAAGLRFRAENAHRLPIDGKGWYLYHKSKNYYRLKSGLREGVGKGTMLGVWAGVFYVCEESVDVFRATWRAGRTVSGMEGVDELCVGEADVSGVRDAFGSLVAGLGTAGLWSLWNKFPLPTAARTAKMGLVAGLSYGLLQDGLALLK
ncbi:hypothetical protein BU16DRAFT_484499, partial [Lophium mytilinum]